MYHILLPPWEKISRRTFLLSALRKGSVGSDLLSFSCSEAIQMELFHKAKAVRLRSHHDKYLLAEENEESVCQDRNGSSRNAKWTVEFLEGGQILRLKSCYGRYLTASNFPFLLGMTGRKVLQTMPLKLDSSIEWEPVREGFQVKLKTRYGYYLRANGGLPPWRNSITHDIPHRSSTQDWILWEVDIVEIQVDSPKPVLHRRVKQDNVASEGSSSYSAGTISGVPKLESCDSLPCSPPKNDGRTIYFTIADDNGEVDESCNPAFFSFKGTSVADLTDKLKEETRLDDIIVCSRNPVNSKIYPLRLHLPPNNFDMHVIVVKSSSKLAKTFRST
ncbi:hypothetical protein H6P81_000263 [Aristolochia fimbriata]|uniref:DUF569 domain-containing protein n=1 Tax=Aristolochia fimbriata TaxID=158543 RepID=A0AAV7F628_ARIFI|nr:hypothetical protein H6P81_000263 [Aristolochia fimbriata]